MGLFDFIKNELIEVIDWVDNTQDTVIWKFQDAGNNIKNGAQLTVRESQNAVLMNEGEFGDIYQPGRHLLFTNNMPITTTLKSWKYGFESPFKVDIYFISTKQFTNLKWGTSGPILLKDSEFGMVRLKSFGNYSISIKDPKCFIKQFAGTNSFVQIDQIDETIKNIISSKLAEVLAEANISVMSLASNYTEVGEKIKPILQTEIESYGLQLEKFFVENVSLPENVEGIIDKKTELNILGGSLNEFNQMQSGIALEKLADNDSGQAIGGVGTGILLNNMMGQNLQANQNNNSANKADLVETLKQLSTLKDQGILTEEEFSKKKQEILNKI